MENRIGIFERYTKEPNDIKYGYLYTTTMECELGNEETTRTVRVWVPEDYFNSNKRYKVMYMADMQNMVDKYTTAYGSWDMDIIIHRLMENGHDGIILAGVDCAYVPDNRASELCPPYKPNLNLRGMKINPTCDMYGEFIFNVLKPLVDKSFRTLPDRANTGVGGSSMGGISSFYLGMKYNDRVSFSLCFSPAFLLYTKEVIDEWFNTHKLKPDDYGRFFFYSGGKQGYENRFYKKTELIYNKLRRQGFTEDQVCYIYDSRLPHHESSWHKYAYEALEWLLRE